MFLLSSLLLAVLVAQAPVRDNGQDNRPSAPATGEGKVSVLVITREGQTAQPIRRATVTLTNTSLGISRVEVTDDDGKFTFEQLPNGRYTLDASKGGYVRMSYGARRYDMPGTPVVVANGQHVSNLTIECPRGAVIAGTVLDQSGRPSAGSSVVVMQYRLIDGVRKLTTPTAVRTAGGLAVAPTDQTGSFRLYGLPAGEYVVRVSARIPPAPGQASLPLTVGFSETYFPGTADPSGAAPIKVAAGEERAGVDFRLMSVPRSNVSGTVVMPGGQPARNVRVAMNGPVVNSAPVAPDGKFSIVGVAPGDYTLFARSMPATANAGEDPAVWGTATIAAGGRDVTDLVITMQPSMTASGKVVFESSNGVAPPSLAGIDVSLAPAPSNVSIGVRIVMKTNASGAFASAGVTPGRYTIQAFVPSSAGQWTIKSAIVRGRDVLDVPIDVEPGEALGDLVVTFTDAVQELSGELADGAGRHPEGFTMVLFAEDPKRWTQASRWIRIAQPGTDGRFVMTGVPAGAYRLAALRDIGPDDMNDPSFLQQIVPASIPVTLAPGEKKIQDVRLR